MLTRVSVAVNFLIVKRNRIAFVSLLSLLPFVGEMQKAVLSLQASGRQAVSQMIGWFSIQAKRDAHSRVSQGMTAIWPESKINVGLLIWPTDSFDFNR